MVPKIVGDVGILALDEQDKLVKIEFFDPARADAGCMSPDPDRITLAMPSEPGKATE